MTPIGNAVFVTHDISDVFFAVSTVNTLAFGFAVLMACAPAVFKSFELFEVGKDLRSLICNLRLRLDVSESVCPSDSSHTNLVHPRYTRHYLNIYLLYSVWTYFELIP